MPNGSQDDGEGGLCCRMGSRAIPSRPQHSGCFLTDISAEGWGEVRGSGVSLSRPEMSTGNQPFTRLPSLSEGPQLCPSESSLISTPVARKTSFQFVSGRSVWVLVPPLPLPSPPAIFSGRGKQAGKTPELSELEFTSLHRGNSANRLSCVLVTSSRLPSPQQSLHHASL